MSGGSQSYKSIGIKQRMKLDETAPNNLSLQKAVRLSTILCAVTGQRENCQLNRYLSIARTLPNKGHTVSRALKTYLGQLTSIETYCEPWGGQRLLLKLNGSVSLDFTLRIQCYHLFVLLKS